MASPFSAAMALSAAISAIIARHRFLLKNVDTRGIQVAMTERIGQGLLVDNAAARGIDQYRAGFHSGDALGIQQTAGLVRQRHVNADEPPSFLLRV